MVEKGVPEGYVFKTLTLRRQPSVPQVLIGFVTNFLDTLGIGSFATTTTPCKLTQMVPDQRLPGLHDPPGYPYIYRWWKSISGL
jgi:hypothetical protein